MSVPKRHHSVPEMLQRRFADVDGQLFFFDKRRPELGIQKTAPRNLFVRQHQYSIKQTDGTKDWSLETRYASLEGYADRIIDKIENAVFKRQFPAFSQSERALVDLFLYEQWRRGPDLYEQIMPELDFAAMLAESLDEYEAEVQPISPTLREQFTSTEAIKRQRHNARVSSLSQSSGRVLEALARKGICLAVTSRSRSFILGSYPVAKLTPPGMSELDNILVEVWLPIHPNIAVVLAGPPEIKAVVTAGPAAVRNTNRAIAKQSNVIAARSRDLIKSMISPALRHFA